MVRLPGYQAAQDWLCRALTAMQDVPTTGQWSPRSLMPIARGGVAMATSALISRRWGGVIVGMTLGLPLTGSRFAPAQVLSDIARLIAQLRDESLTVRGNAAHALGAIGPTAKDAIPELVRLLKDPEVVGRASAAFALGAIGPAAK